MAKKREKFYKTPVISGKYKGKNIQIPAVSTTRSSKSVLRESLFNTIQFDIVGRGFVEVFAGSGSVAIEAVSRGAKRAWCIEKNRSVYQMLNSNIQNITQGEIESYFGDSFELFETVLRELKSQNLPSFFYFDPPFSIRDGMEDIYEKVFNLIKRIDKEIGLMVIIEYMSDLELPKSIGDFELAKSKKFGKSSLAYYLPKED